MTEIVQPLRGKESTVVFAMEVKQALEQAQYIASLIMPVTEPTRAARERIMQAIDSGDIRRTYQAVEESRGRWSARVGKGIMTIEVRQLADRWLELVRARILHISEQEAA